MKNKRILVDTSAWVLSFKSSGHEKLKIFLKETIDRNQAVITPFIILELLQGCKTEKDFVLLHHDHHFRLIAKHSRLDAVDYMS